MAERPIVTRRCEQVDDYHGELVADPYRWLEDPDSAETKSWVEAQSDAAEAFLASAGAREEIRSRLREIWDFPRWSPPFEKNGQWFQSRNSGLQDQPVVYRMGSAGEAGEVLLDPNTLAAGGTVSVPAFVPDDSGSLVAYATNAAGSDWTTWRVKEVATGRDRPDEVHWSKYGVAAWDATGSGFYYCSTDRPPAGEELRAPVGVVRIAFHAVGTPQSSDEVVFERSDEPEWLPHPKVTDDGRFLVITTTRGTDPYSRVEVLDLSRPGLCRVVLVAGFTCRAEVVANVGTKFVLLTDDGAPRQRLVTVALEAPGAPEELVAEREAVLVWAGNCGGRLVCHYLEDACSRLVVFELDGTFVREIALPSLASVAPDREGAAVKGRAGSAIFHYELRSFLDPGSLWSHDVESGETLLVRRSEAAFDPSGLTCERVFVTASDGARLPLFLTRRRDLAQNGEAPVLLYGYGGFSVPITPDFYKDGVVFAERGGIFAVAVLRGGGEYGSAWHDAGRLGNKQRVFDDFCDCARRLAHSGWTRPTKTAISGGSNGGLLVGACLTQHPELFGAAVAEVGVLDMLRFHKFTIGWAWKSDFGDPDDPEQYGWLRAYSPLHNLRPGTCYPPTLLMTADHDDRVVPAHSFKFAAAMQAAVAEGCGPVLLRVASSAGHGHGKPTSKSIAERADVLAFLDEVLFSHPLEQETS
jgi:prolyl oligopeptidase